MAGEVKRAALPFDTFKIEENFDRMLMLIYGASDTGKTVLVGSSAAVPEMSPVCYVDINKGTASLSQFDFGKADNAENLIPVKVEHYATGNEKRRFTTVYAYLAANKGMFKTLVIDGLDDLQRLVEGEVRDKYGENQDVRQFWGAVLEKMQNALRMIKDLNMHVLVTSHEMLHEDSDSGTSMIMPSLRGSISRHVDGYFDTVGRLMVRKVDGKTVRVLHVGGSKKFIGRDRFGTIGEMIDGQGPLVLEPTMQQIYAMTQKNRGDK